MKNILLMITLLISFNSFAQQAIYTDNDGDGIIEYTLKNEMGNVMETGYYLNGKMTGTWTLYFPNGKKQMVAKFKNGIKHGTWLIYDGNNRLVTEVVYDNNKKLKATQRQYASN
jgi:antitoxin component YwqK of YwqJK toxin-antitoxin module